MSLNIKGIADLAEVSTATVSRVLNGGVVKRETKEKISKIMRKYNYSPSVVAKQMHLKKANCVLVVLPDITNTFYNYILKGIVNFLTKHAINTIIKETSKQLETDGNYFKIIDNHTVDAVIILTRISDETTLKKLQENFTYPILQCSEYNEGLNIPYISIDNLKASYDACKLLIKKGCNKLYFIRAYAEYTFSKKRLQGFINAVNDSKDNQIKYDIIDVNLDYESGYESFDRLVFCAEDKVGVISISDILALGLLNRAIDENIKIPEQLSIIGFDNIEAAKYVRPSLTTVAQPMYDLGIKSAQTIIEMIDSAHVESVFLKHTIIERKTT